MEKYFMAAIGAANLIGSTRTVTIANFFGSAENAWNAEAGEFENINLPASALKSFLEFRKNNPNTPEILQEYLAKKNFNLCCITDEEYPPILRNLLQPPAVLYYRGELQTFAERIAMVGTRQNTEYGRQVALDISENLARAGLTIVSGAAKGIDKFSHVGALRSGRTVAVLGGGINYYFKTEDKNLLEEISETGLVISEFNPNLPPNIGTFPARNRIIAGLSRAVIVVEAGDKSGALLTVAEAKKIRRDIFAVPGNIFSAKSRGCNNLIMNGEAILLKDFHDILSRYNFTYEQIPAVKKSPPKKIVEKKIIEKKVLPEIKLNGLAKKIFDIIPADDYITPDEIFYQLDEDIQINELAAVLTELWQKDLVAEDNQRYKRR